MWGNYTNQPPGLGTPYSPVLNQGSQGFLPSSQTANSQDSFSSPKRDKKTWNWPLIAAGLGILSTIGLVIVSKGKTAQPIPPPLSDKAAAEVKKVPKGRYKGFYSKKFRFVRALPGFKISKRDYRQVTRSYVKVPAAFRKITESHNKKVFLVTGGVTNAPHMAPWKNKLTWDGRKYNDVGGVSGPEGAVISVDLEKSRLNDTVLHEVGHNTDRSLGNMSSGRKWKKLYEQYKDQAVQKHECSGDHLTFRSSYCRGKPSEFFAECFFYYYSSAEKRAILPKDIQHYFAALEKKHSSTR